MSNPVPTHDEIRQWVFQQMLEGLCQGRGLFEISTRITDTVHRWGFENGEKSKKSQPNRANGGRATAAKMTPEQRTARARKAANTRHQKGAKE